VTRKRIILLAAAAAVFLVVALAGWQGVRAWWAWRGIERIEFDTAEARSQLPFVPLATEQELEEPVPAPAPTVAIVEYDAILAIGSDERTQEEVAEAIEAGLPVQVGHQKRHGLAHRRLRDIVADESAFGHIVHIDSKQLGFPVFPTFYTCMLEWQCHNLDYVMALGGDVTEVEAKSFLVDDRHGALNALLRFESGALATLTWGTYGGPGPFSERVEVVGDRNRGVTIANAREVTVFEESAGEVWTSDWNPISQNQSHVFNGYVPQIRHFVEHVRSGQAPEPSIHDEVRTMQVLTDIATRADIPLEWAFISSAP
jgi:predicted dehydrogenase